MSCQVYVHDHMCMILSSNAATQTLVLTGQTEEQENEDDDPFTAINIEVHTCIQQNQTVYNYAIK